MNIKYRFTTNYLEDCSLVFSIEQIEQGDIQSLLDAGWSIKGRDRYTGLKDKNGVEIYESDYAKNYAGKIGLIKFGSFISKECDCQDPRYYGWYLEYVDGKCLPLDDNTEQWITVISNIHDNPSLLEVQP